MAEAPTEIKTFVFAKSVQFYPSRRVLMRNCTDHVLPRALVQVTVEKIMLHRSCIAVILLDLYILTCQLTGGHFAQSSSRLHVAIPVHHAQHSQKRVWEILATCHATASISSLISSSLGGLARQSSQTNIHTHMPAGTYCFCFDVL